MNCSLLLGLSGFAVALVTTLEGVSYARAEPFALARVDAESAVHDVRSALAHGGTEWTAVRTPICRISHHPRNGSRAPQRVCPEMLADGRSRATSFDGSRSHTGAQSSAPALKTASQRRRAQTNDKNGPAFVRRYCHVNTLT
jgi:hypothetical protein